MESTWYGRLDEGSNPSGSTFASPKQQTTQVGCCFGGHYSAEALAKANIASPRTLVHLAVLLQPGYGGRSPPSTGWNFHITSIS